MDPQTRFKMLTGLIVLFGLLGVLLIIVLAVVWRRHLIREQRVTQEMKRMREVAPHIDTWQSAAERYDDARVPREPGFPDPDEDGTGGLDPDDAWDADGDEDLDFDEEEPDEDDEDDEEPPPPWL